MATAEIKVKLIAKHRADETTAYHPAQRQVAGVRRYTAQNHNGFTFEKGTENQDWISVIA